MAALNLSSNGPSILKSYESIVNGTLSTERPAQSPTYGHWAVFTVSAPLVNAFQQSAGGKESTLRVQNTSEGELDLLIDEFSDGRIQFAFLKIKDPNTLLPKCVLVGWCGEGVPERTKGYFTSHLAVVSKTLRGYHVQMIVRSDRDLTPESILRKVSDASGSKYAGNDATLENSEAPKPWLSESAFVPTLKSAGGSNSTSSISSRARPSALKDSNVDADGWGADAPPVTRTHLENVPSSYQPTRVNMQALGAPGLALPLSKIDSESSEDDKVVKGGYQPVGKVDIASLRQQANSSASGRDDRPTVVKGSYEPVGKVDIAAIRARSRPSLESSSANPADLPTKKENQKSLQDVRKELTNDRPIPTPSSERLTSLPKPKVSNRFGAGDDSFGGTNPPNPASRTSEPRGNSQAPLAGKERTFADQDRKTPAQLWTEKKARELGISSAREISTSGGAGDQHMNISSGNGEWKSGYEGKSWAPVQTQRTGQSSGGMFQNLGEDIEGQPAIAGNIGSIRDRYQTSLTNATTAGRSNPPPLEALSKPDNGPDIQNDDLANLTSRPQDQGPSTRGMGPFSTQVARSPTLRSSPELASGSPVQIAMPVGIGDSDQMPENSAQKLSSPSLPVSSLAQAVPDEKDLTEEAPGLDSAREVAKSAAVTSFGESAIESAFPELQITGKRALVQYDYEKAEDNEITLREGDYVVNVDMVDADWWMGQNQQGETGLFPSNYVEIVEDEIHGSAHEMQPEVRQPADDHGASAIALYDYEAAEGNELSFPEMAKILNVEFPDEDWWSGEYGGQSGLFPANYVRLEG